jgi:hypothetical protein
MQREPSALVPSASLNGPGYGCRNCKGRARAALTDRTGAVLLRVDVKIGRLRKLRWAGLITSAPIHGTCCVGELPFSGLLHEIPIARMATIEVTTTPNVPDSPCLGYVERTFRRREFALQFLLRDRHLLRCPVRMPADSD